MDENGKRLPWLGMSTNHINVFVVSPLIGFLWVVLPKPIFLGKRGVFGRTCVHVFLNACLWGTETSLGGRGGGGGGEQGELFLDRGIDCV